MKATLKKINEYLATLTEYGDDMELVKGNGYFYFRFKPFTRSLLLDRYPYWPPDSIDVCHLNHMTLEDWKKWVEFGIKEWDTKDGKEAEGEK